MGMYDDKLLFIQGLAVIGAIFLVEFFAILCSFGIATARIVIALTITMFVSLIVRVFLL